MSQFLCWMKAGGVLWGERGGGGCVWCGIFDIKRDAAITECD